jgi:hypothetical protein
MERTVLSGAAIDQIIVRWSGVLVWLQTTARLDDARYGDILMRIDEEGEQVILDALRELEPTLPRTEVDGIPCLVAGNMLRPVAGGEWVRATRSRWHVAVDVMLDHGMVYHRPGCEHWDLRALECKHVSLIVALAGGYVDCAGRYPGEV